MHRKVFVIEDDPEIRETLVDLLEDSGIPAEGAFNGRDALEKLRNSLEKPCLIFLDLMMPVMDGRTFRSIQQSMPELRDIPVVIISAFQNVAEQAQSLGAASYLTKPLKLDQVRTMVERYC